MKNHRFPLITSKRSIRTLVVGIALVSTIAFGSHAQEVARLKVEELEAFPEAWSLLGPVSSSQVASLSNREAALRASAEGGVSVGGTEYEWALVASSGPIVELDEHFGTPESVSAYAYLEVVSGGERSSLLGFGSDDGARVWVNGELKHSTDVSRSVTPGEDLIPVQWRDGVNSVLARVDNASGKWGFSLRVMPQGELTARLRQSVGRGDLGETRTLLEFGADPLEANESGLNSMHIARVLGYETIEKELTEVAGEVCGLPGPETAIPGMFSSMDSIDSSGATVLAAFDDEVVYEGAFGAASIGLEVPMEPDTKLRIGSITKQFTATAILKLTETGELELQDSVAKFFPEFPRGEDVTVYHLLTHTSGIPSYTSMPEFRDGVGRRVEPEEIVSRFQGKPFDFEPGEQWSYNNSGYYLLGEIVAKVSGKSLGAYLEETVFGPANMDDTGFHDSKTILKNEARGYSYDGDEVTYALNWDMSQAGGAGAMYSTVGDLHRWHMALFSGDILSRESIELAMTPTRLNGEEEPAETLGGAGYGLGWGISEIRGLPIWSHSGGLDGWSANLLWAPDQELTVAILSNAHPSPPGFAPGPISQRISEFLLHEEMEPREELVAGALEPDHDLDDYVGRYDYVSGILTVTRKGDQLMARLSGQPPYEIFPSDDDLYYWKIVDARIRFLRNEKGAVTGAEHEQNGTSFEVEKLSDAQFVGLSEDLLERVVGKYQYGPAVMTVSRDGDRLIAQLTGQPPLEIRPISETEFHWVDVNARIILQLDDAGVVTGVRHIQGNQDFIAARLME